MNRKIRVGFVSSHFRRHSVCKLFCGIIANLDTDVFDVYAFSSLSETKEDERSKELVNVLTHRYHHCHHHYYNCRRRRRHHHHHYH